jgi:hypothetical protein
MNAASRKSVSPGNLRWLGAVALLLATLCARAAHAVEVRFEPVAEGV